ncbi:MAG: hypothetical protein LIO86_10330 [Lachnospiraceae bacterium]|nr:hypothetical protein [Lachnospiraceae bacterium]
MILDLIRQAQTDREISHNLDPDGAFKVYTAAIIGVALDWSCCGGKYDEKERLKEIFDTIFHR